MSVKQCFTLFIADKKEFKEWTRFRNRLFRLGDAGASLRFEDVVDMAITSPGDNEQCQKLIDLITHRDIIVIVASGRLKACIDDGIPVDFELQGETVRLDGTSLREQLARDDVKCKTVIISLDENEGDMNVPAVLSGCFHLNKADEDVFNQLMSFIIGT